MSKTLRLAFPEWQAGCITSFDLYLTELPMPERYYSYAFGSKILQIIAPQATGPERVVPVPMEIDREALKTVKGICGQPIIVQITKDAQKILEEENPDRIVTLGGDCSTSIPPFTYLAHKYNDDTAIVWIDSHPDLCKPGDEGFDGYNAMALGHILGFGDDEVLACLSGKQRADRVMCLGLRNYLNQEQRFKDLGLNTISPQENRENPQKVIEWLKSTGCSKVMIHLDLDVLDPEEAIFAVGIEPNGMKMAEVADAINRINDVADVVGFTVAEHVPRVELRLRNFLHQLSVFIK